PPLPPPPRLPRLPAPPSPKFPFVKTCPPPAPLFPPAQKLLPDQRTWLVQVVIETNVCHPDLVGPIARVHSGSARSFDSASLRSGGQDRCVQRLRLLCDCSPTKILFYAFAAGFSKSFA